MTGPVRPSGDPVRVSRAFADLVALPRGAEVTVADHAQQLVDVAVDLLDVWAAGMLLADPSGDPSVLAASTHEVELVELVQVRSGEGPCLAAMAVGAVVRVPDLDELADRWPQWTAGARAAGVTAAYGVPVRAGEGGEVVGAVNLFLRGGDPLGDADLAVASALADVAGAWLEQNDAARRARTLAEQLQHALDSRVVVEQAKGALAERRGVSPGEAFRLLRDGARATSRPLTEVARAVLEGAEPA